MFYIEEKILHQIKNLREAKGENPSQLQYYIGKTYYNTGFGKISNRGGNFNSIGIESCVNVNSDLHLTWQKTAKLVAYLMEKNNLGFDRIKQHHYFSGKDCPQTIRTAKLWEYFIELVKVEFQMRKYINEGVKFEFKSSKPEYVDKNGRVIKRPVNYNWVVPYFVKITMKDGQNKSLVLTTFIPKA